jgi:hypothetical protein
MHRRHDRRARPDRPLRAVAATGFATPEGSHCHARVSGSVYYNDFETQGQTTRSSCLLMAGLLGATCTLLQAQQPSYPPHDLVQPGVTLSVGLDATSSDFLYSYTVVNGAAAQQRVNEVHILSTGLVTGAVAPANWDVFPSTKGVTTWAASGPPDPSFVAASDWDIPATLSEIVPGTSRAGFVLKSPCAISGFVTYYVRGFNHILDSPIDANGDFLPEPAWQQDAVSGVDRGTHRLLDRP